MSIGTTVAPWLELLFAMCHFTGNTSIRRDYKADKANLHCHFIEPLPSSYISTSGIKIHPLHFGPRASRAAKRISSISEYGFMEFVWKVRESVAL